MARYHPTDDWLANYANDAIDRQTAVLVATHLTYCPQCRKTVRYFEEIGGALLDEIDIDAIGASADPFEFEATAANDLTPPADEGQSDLPNGSMNEFVPRPLLRYVFDRLGTTDLEALPWKFYGPGIRRAVLFENADGGAIRILRAQPGAVFPHHGHGSEELTVVLKGAYRDETDRFDVGDVQCVPEAVKHQPIIENGEECIALVVSEKPTIPTGLVARLFQRIAGA